MTAVLRRGPKASRPDPQLSADDLSLLSATDSVRSLHPQAAQSLAARLPAAARAARRPPALIMTLS